MDNLSKTMAELPPTQNKRSGPKNWKPIALAIGVPLGLIAVLWLVFREQLVRAIPVETAHIILLEQQNHTQSEADELLFQASGWVEPDPWPIKLAVKVDGFVEQVFVKEGESVTNGQLVATLDPADAQLALHIAQANVRRHEASLESRKLALLASTRQAEAATFSVEAAEAQLRAKEDLQSRYQNTAPAVVSPLERTAAEQAVIEFKANEKKARAELNAHRAQCTRIEADVKVAEAALIAARRQQETAQLALDRTVIRATMDGIVLHRYTNPGDKRRAGADDPNSAVIAALYDPKHLQVRVDVPIAEAAKMAPGQPTRIFSALLPGQTLTGRVTRIIGQADLQRNTLQAKVRIDDPDPKLRPDILCRVEFWNATSSGTSGNAASGNHALWIPIAALQSDAAQQDIWVIDPLSQTAHQRSIKLTPATRKGLRQVADGLRANEMVVTQGQHSLEEGARIKEVRK